MILCHSCGSYDLLLIIWLEARLWPNIGNKLSHVSTLFTGSAMTLPEVNRFR